MRFVAKKYPRPAHVHKPTSAGRPRVGTPDSEAHHGELNRLLAASRVSCTRSPSASSRRFGHSCEFTRRSQVVSGTRPLNILRLFDRLHGPALAAPVPARSIALNMPRPGWQVNSEYRSVCVVRRSARLMPRNSFIRVRVGLFLSLLPDCSNCLGSIVIDPGSETE